MAGAVEWMVAGPSSDTNKDLVQQAEIEATKAEIEAYLSGTPEGATPHERLKLVITGLFNTIVESKADLKKRVADLRNTPEPHSKETTDLVDAEFDSHLAMVTPRLGAIATLSSLGLMVETLDGPVAITRCAVTAGTEPGQLVLQAFPQGFTFPPEQISGTPPPPRT